MPVTLTPKNAATRAAMTAYVYHDKQGLLPSNFLPSNRLISFDAYVDYFLEYSEKAYDLNQHYEAECQNIQQAKSAQQEKRLNFLLNPKPSKAPYYRTPAAIIYTYWEYFQSADAAIFLPEYLKALLPKNIARGYNGCIEFCEDHPELDGQAFFGWFSLNQHIIEAWYETNSVYQQKKQEHWNRVVYHAAKKHVEELLTFSGTRSAKHQHISLKSSRFFDNIEKGDFKYLALIYDLVKEAHEFSSNLISLKSFEQANQQALKAAAKILRLKLLPVINDVFNEFITKKPTCFSDYGISENNMILDYLGSVFGVLYGYVQSLIGRVSAEELMGLFFFNQLITSFINPYLLKSKTDSSLIVDKMLESIEKDPTCCQFFDNSGKTLEVVYGGVLQPLFKDYDTSETSAIYYQKMAELFAGELTQRLSKLPRDIKAYHDGKSADLSHRMLTDEDITAIQNLLLSEEGKNLSIEFKLSGNDFSNEGISQLTTWIEDERPELLLDLNFDKNPNASEAMKNTVLAASLIFKIYGDVFLDPGYAHVFNSREGFAFPDVIATDNAVQLYTEFFKKPENNKPAEKLVRYFLREHQLIRLWAINHLSDYEERRSNAKNQLDSEQQKNNTFHFVLRERKQDIEPVKAVLIAYIYRYSLEEAGKLPAGLTGDSSQKEFEDFYYNMENSKQVNALLVEFETNRTKYESWYTPWRKFWGYGYKRAADKLTWIRPALRPIVSDILNEPPVQPRRTWWQWLFGISPQKPTYSLVATTDNPMLAATTTSSSMRSRSRASQKSMSASSSIKFRASEPLPEDCKAHSKAMKQGLQPELEDDPTKRMPEEAVLDILMQAHGSELDSGPRVGSPTPISLETNKNNSTTTYTQVHECLTAVKERSSTSLNSLEVEAGDIVPNNEIAMTAQGTPTSVVSIAVASGSPSQPPSRASSPPLNRGDYVINISSNPNSNSAAFRLYSPKPKTTPHSALSSPVATMANQVGATKLRAMS